MGEIITADALHAIVVEVGGRSFIRVKAGEGGYWHSHERVAANGIYPLPKAPGDESFLFFDGIVETLERIVPAKRITTKYLLREDLRGAAKAETISVSDYEALDSADRTLYAPVYEDIPQGVERIPFARQAEAGDPSKLPQGVVSTDQNYFARFPAFWHLGPVRATARYVLWRTAKRLNEIIRDNPYISWSSGWGRDLDEYLTSTHRTAFFIEAKSMRVGQIEVAAKKLHIMFSIDRKDTHGYARQIDHVDAPNLEALEAKVVAYVEELTTEARTWATPDRCPCCQRRFAKKPGAGVTTSQPRAA